MFKFEKLDVWKKAVDLHGTISLLSRSIEQKDQFSIGEQIRRASLSISTNIAEGTGRESVREALYFFNIAKGSVYEVVSLLYVMRKSGMSRMKFIRLYTNNAMRLLVCRAV